MSLTTALLPSRAWRFLLALWDQFKQDKVPIRASGLAYSSLLATVPLVAVLFALFSAFGAFDDVKVKVEDLLIDHFLPTQKEELVTYLNDFTEAARSLGLPGFILLILTAILLLDTIESNFNDIWHVRRRRRMVSKITSYTSVLVFGTLFLGASLSMSAKIKTEIFTGSILDRSFVNWALDWGLTLSLTLSGFLLMYLIVPNTRVRFKSAALGALVGGLLWELGKNLFANSIGRSVKYSTIYGSLAAFPIFLVWLYVTWVILLLGLEIAFTHQHFKVLERERATNDLGGRNKVAQAVRIYTLIARRFHFGEAPPTLEELAERFVMPLDKAEDSLDRLTQAGLARTTGTGTANEGFVPARSLDRVRVADVMGAFLGDAETAPTGPVERAAAEVLAEFRSGGESALADRTFREMVQGLGDPSAPVVAEEAIP